MKIQILFGIRIRPKFIIRGNTGTGKALNSYMWQRSNNPTVYTKLSCFLPWIAKQYGLKYENKDLDNDSSCSEGTGDLNDVAGDAQTKKCLGHENGIPSDLPTGEKVIVGWIYV